MGGLMWGGVGVGVGVGGAWGGVLGRARQCMSSGPVNAYILQDPHMLVPRLFPIPSKGSQHASRAAGKRQSNTQADAVRHQSRSLDSQKQRGS